MMNFEFLKGKKGFRLLAQFTSDPFAVRIIICIFAESIANL